MRINLNDCENWKLNSGSIEFVWYIDRCVYFWLWKYEKIVNWCIFD